MGSEGLLLIGFPPVSEDVLSASGKATLPDMEKMLRAGRFVLYLVDKSAVINVARCHDRPVAQAQADVRAISPEPAVR